MAAPQLRLEVSLNLAGFRTEVQKLTNIAQSEFTPKINVKFNRQTLDTELNNLQAAIKRRVYRVEIGGNIDALPDKIKTLKEQLSSLESLKIDLGVGAVKSLSKKDAKQIATDLRAQITGEQKKIYVGVGATAELTGEEARKVVANLRAQIVGERKKIVVGVGAIKALSNEDAQAIASAISAQVAGKKGAILVPASIVTSITGDDVAAFKSTVKEKLSGIKIKVGIEAQVPGAATPASGERKRSAGYEAALQSISGLQVEQLRRRAFSSLGEESRTAQQVSNWLNTIVSEGLQGKAKTSQLTAVREFLADALATAAGRNIEARMQPLRGQTSIEAARSATNINKILDPIAQYTQKPEAAQQMLRMLPESRISTNTLDIASKQARYYEAVPGAESFQSGVKGFDPLLKSIAKDFTEYTKSLSPTNPWIGKISDGIANMVSSAAVPLQTQKLLPAAGQSNASRMTRSLFAGLPPIQAPSIGQENAPLSAGATRSLNKARRLLGMPIGPVSSYVSNPWAGSVTVPPVTTASPSRGLPVAGSLPPAGATSNYGVAAQAQAMAQATQQFGFMRAPSMPPSLVRPSSGGPPTPPIPPRGGGGGGGGFFGGMQFNMPKLPGAGLVREIGEEFGFAAKQVLLYGTAYKALGLLQAFPSQVGEAVGALQSFRNTLNAISPTAQEAAASSEFILNIVDKYNVPLQSARDGFTKLYASMAPTGFSGNEIRDLFTGISQAAATFGMSADKVDRVTYAFAQMASKGQVMSEELKGQLGDVLPGAMGIFAKAAGFEGADAIQKFGKALEDGAYKGKPMRDLLKNVTIELKKEFGPGAEGAARTYQGVMTRMANSTRLFYESFEPVAVGFLNSVVMPITSGIKTVTDGFNAFFTGTAAKTSGGLAIAQELEKLKPAFDGIRQNIQQLVPVFGQFAQIALGLGKILLQIAGNPFVGFMAKIYAIIVPLNIALGAMRGLWALNSLQLLIFNARIAAGTTTLTAFRAMMAATGATAATTSATLRAGFASTGVGVILLGIGLLIERFVSMNQALDDTKAKALGAADAIRSMSETEARQAENQATRDVKILQDLQQKKNEGKAVVAITKEEQAALERANVKTGKMVVPGQMARKGSLPELLNYGQASVDVTQIQGAVLARQGIASTAAQRIKDLRFQDKQQQQQVNAAPVEGIASTNKTNLESYYGLQDTLAKDAAEFAAAQAEEEFRHKIELLDRYYDIQETRANAYQKDALRFEREMVMIEARRQEERLKAKLEVQKAQSSVAGGVGEQGVSVGSSGYIDKSVLQTFLVSQGFGRTTGDYTNKGHATPNHTLNAMDMGILGGSDADALRKTIAMERKLKATGAFGNQLFGPERDPYGHGAGKGGQNIHLHIPTPGGKVKMTPGLADLMNYTGTAIAGAVPGKVTPSAKRDAVAEQNTLQASIAKTNKERMADEKAVQEQIVALEKYRASAFPVIEQEIQNKLLAKRNELFRSGITDEQIDKEIKLYENQERGAAGLAAVNRLQTKKIISDAQAAVLTKELNKDIANQNNLLQQNATLIGQSKFDQTIKGIRNQIDMARALTPEQEMRTQIAQEGFTGQEAESIFQERKTLQGAEKLKADMQGIAGAIGDSFGNAFKGIITGSMTAQQALAGFFQSVADSFADMVAKMIAEYLKMALIKGIMSIIGGIPGSLGGGGENLGANSSAVFGLNSADMTQYSPLLPMAKGGVLSGGFQAFANGGIVTGPTLGLVGEGRYNEAVIPLPDGKSVPVQLSGGDCGSQINSNITVNVSNGQAQSSATGSNSSELGRKIEGAVKQVIVGELRPGGLLASR